MREISIYEKLNAPFNYEDINWRIISTFNKDQKNLTARAIVVPYIKKDVIQDRLDEVFGFDGWFNEYKECGNDAQLCGISINTGSAFITKWDGASIKKSTGEVSMNEIDKMKSCFADSFKRAAKVLGIGRYISKFKQPIFVDVDLKGEKKTPTIRVNDIYNTLKDIYITEVERIFGKSYTNLINFNHNEPENSIQGEDKPKLASKEMLSRIILLLKQKNVNVSSVLNRYSINSLEKLTVEEANKTISILESQEPNQKTSCQSA
ncbi:MAG: Rad52/Rad22 family DNA repair protein [Clostridium celatum]|uniref:Rad52/Rad22 family DNA repair protein n=1 Tax=Clostridium tertium TaxID=1559 RepID=UPI002904E441|nr:Rad52/Rad22 family DNA repair protein [Clostridium celatum]